MQNAPGGKWRSERPVDERIRQLVRGAKQRSEDVADIVAHVSRALFARETRVDWDLVGQEYLGRRLRRREDGLFGHVAKRVVIDRGWPPGTSATEYLDDLHAAVAHPDAGVGVVRQGLDPAAIFVVDAQKAIDSERYVDWGESAKLLVVIYKADRGTIVTGYRTQSISDVADWRSIRWLRQMT